MNWKQIFCNHLYQGKEKVLLNKTREIVWHFGYADYEHYAIREVCVKCERERWTKKRVLII